LPRMQRTRGIPVDWLSSGLCPNRPKGWIPIIIIWYTISAFVGILYSVNLQNAGSTIETRIISLLHQILPHDGLWVILNTASLSFFRPVLCFWKNCRSLGRLKMSLANPNSTPGNLWNSKYQLGGAGTFCSI